MARNRILVVEDDVSIHTVIAKNLTAAGYAVFSCMDGAQAERVLAHDSDFDLALLDVMLPGLDGFALLGILRHMEIPVIFLTARSDVESKVRGLREGADDYIVKPFEVLELLVRIEKTLERAGKLRQVLEVGRLTINLQERSVRIGGKEISLKPMEFDLLVMLAKNKNIALSRERLLHGVWGVDFQGETRTVDVHIAHLRKALMGSQVSIETLTGVGYKLVAGA